MLLIFCLFTCFPSKKISSGLCLDTCGTLKNQWIVGHFFPRSTLKGAKPDYSYSFSSIFQIHTIEIFSPKQKNA